MLVFFFDVSSLNPSQLFENNQTRDTHFIIALSHNIIKNKLFLRPHIKSYCDQANSLEHQHYNTITK